MSSHVDPAPGCMGWGELGHNPLQSLVLEKETIEGLENVSSLLCTADETVGGSLIDPVVKAALKKKMFFDQGWDFMVAERIVYGFDASETWMISQAIGNCVGASHVGLLATRIAHEILAEGDAEEPLGKKAMGAPFIPFSYGVGRLAGDMLGPGDGSYCGAQMEGTLKYGFLPCFTQGLEALAGSGDEALPQGTAKVNRLFGSSKKELEKWMPKALTYKMTEAPRVKTASDAKTLMCDKYTPLQICSGQGFTYDRFDSKYGVHLYKASGKWSHSMQLVAAFEIKGQWFICIRNQWGLDAHKGSPEIGIAGGCMVITWETFERWILSAEVMGIGEIEGLPSNPGF